MYILHTYIHTYTHIYNNIIIYYHIYILSYILSYIFVNLLWLVYMFMILYAFSPMRSEGFVFSRGLGVVLCSRPVVVANPELPRLLN